MVALNAGLDVVVRQAVVSFVSRQSTELQAATEAQSKYLSFLSHDLRGGLNGVFLMIEVLKRELADEPRLAETMEDLDGMRRSLLETVGTMDRFLHAERFRKGKVQIRPSPMDLRTLLNEQVAQLAYQAKDKKIELKVDCDGKCQLVSDRDMLTLILQNLLSNAVKYTQKGGVWVEGKCCEDGKLLVSVRDSGPGIATETLATLFTPFTRGVTHGQSGVGLGLSIARQASELVGGTGVGGIDWWGRGRRFLCSCRRNCPSPPRRRRGGRDANNSSKKAEKNKVRLLEAEAPVFAFCREETGASAPAIKEALRLADHVPSPLPRTISADTRSAPTNPERYTDSKSPTPAHRHDQAEEDQGRAGDCGPAPFQMLRGEEHGHRQQIDQHREQEVAGLVSGLKASGPGDEAGPFDRDQGAERLSTLAIFGGPGPEGQAVFAIHSPPPPPPHECERGASAVRAGGFHGQAEVGRAAGSGEEAGHGEAELCRHRLHDDGPAVAEFWRGDTKPGDNSAEGDPDSAEIFVPAEQRGREQREGDRADQHAPRGPPAPAEQQIGQRHDRQVLDVHHHRQRQSGQRRPAIQPPQREGKHQQDQRVGFEHGHLAAHLVFVEQARTANATISNVPRPRTTKSANYRIDPEEQRLSASIAARREQHHLAGAPLERSVSGT